jgi:hypothetical protein
MDAEARGETCDCRGHVRADGGGDVYGWLAKDEDDDEEDEEEDEEEEEEEEEVSGGGRAAGAETP